ncbi:hypothetical protein [Streptomyces sp. NBC_00322]
MRSRTCGGAVPQDFLPARAHLRRLAMAVEDLFDQLLEDIR